MSSFLDAGNESVRHERAVVSLASRSETPLAEVRGIFASELARLKMGAKVHAYLQILATSNVRAILRRIDSSC